MKIEKATRKFIAICRDNGNEKIKAAAVEYAMAVEEHISWLEMETLQLEIAINNQKNQIRALDNNLIMQVEWTKKLMKKYMNFDAWKNFKPQQ